MDVAHTKRLQLVLQQSSYKYMLYTDCTATGRAQVPVKSRCNGVAFMSLSETSDGLLVFGLRARHTEYMPLQWHCVPAGILGAPDPKLDLKNKFTEDTGLAWTHV